MPVPVRSVAKADVAELSAALDSAVDAEKAHHLVIVGTNKVLSTTQFKQMFYSRGDDFFQIANVYECPDSCNSVHSSVWGIDCKDPHNSAVNNAPGLVTMRRNRLTSGANSNGYSIQAQTCFNFNKLGGRENDPKGCAWAYSYAHDADRNFYAQHEVMGYLEKDTCVKRDFWTACSRMSIEDQLYGLAFASETDQDLCMAVTCARRWSEVEDALAESCTAADEEIKRVSWEHQINGATFTLTAGVTRIKIYGSQGGLIFDCWPAAGVTTYTALTAAVGAGGSINVASNSGAANVPPTAAGQAPYRAPGFSVGCAATTALVNFEIGFDGTAATSQGGLAVVSGGTMLTAGTVANLTEFHDDDGGVVDLFINVRVSNGHPKALDTILRVRFTVAYVAHEPSALHTWNTRASTAAAGVIQSGVVGDAPEGGKEQHEDTTVVVA